MWFAWRHMTRDTFRPPWSMEQRLLQMLKALSGFSCCVRWPTFDERTRESWSAGQRTRHWTGPDRWLDRTGQQLLTIELVGHRPVDRRKRPVWRSWSMWGAAWQHLAVEYAPVSSIFCIKIVRDLCACHKSGGRSYMVDRSTLSNVISDCVGSCDRHRAEISTRGCVVEPSDRNTTLTLKYWSNNFYSDYNNCLYRICLTIGQRRSVSRYNYSTQLIRVQVELDGGCAAGGGWRWRGWRRLDAGRRRGWRDGRWSAARRHEQLLQHRRWRTCYSCLSRVARYTSRVYDISPSDIFLPRTFPDRTILPPFLHGVGHSPLRALPPPSCANKAIYRNWKLALTRIPNPNRPTTRVLTLTNPWGVEFSENWH